MTNQPMFTQRHYNVIAEFVRTDERSWKSNTAHARFASDFAVLFAADNPRFQRSRFMAAAMPAWMVGTRHANIWERYERSAPRDGASSWHASAMLAMAAGR